jgi:superfamily II DNA or RNA helicase
MIELPTLYPHQESLRDRTRAALAKHGRVILCAPPGMGKTRTAKWILGAGYNREPKSNQSGRSLFTVHRRGLVYNARNSFAEEPAIPHGVIMSGAETSYGHRVQVASIDTLLSWFVKEEYPDELTFDLVIWDEAHSHHPKFAKFLEAHDAARERLGFHPAYVIGLTATPQAKGLADVYKEIVQGPSTQWLIDNGFLAPFRYFRATQGRLEKLVKRGSEYTKGSVCEAMDGLAGDLVRDWQRLAEGRPTVGFFPRRSQAQDAAEQLADAGLRVAYVDGETPDEERHNIFAALNDHRIDYLCNVQVVERGTDIPRIGCVQLCVAVASIVRYRQMIGRGSRTHPDKTDCLVLDHAGNVARNGFFEDDPNWSLDITTKEPGEINVRPTIECPKCNAIYRGGRCRNCGYEPSPKERKSQGLEFDGSELTEIKPQEKPPPTVKSAEELMISALYMAGRSGRTWRQACGIFKSLNTKQGTNCKVPRTVNVAGRRYEMVRYGSLDSARRVSSLYPFVDGGEHGGDYLVEERTAAEAPY